MSQPSLRPLATLGRSTPAFNRRIELPRREAQRSRNHVAGARTKNRGKAKKLLHRETNAIMSASAQFRTCLWPRVGWWASGQEAGQPPGVRSKLKADRRKPTGESADCSSSEPLNRQPEAKPAHPALNGGRGLKQRRSGLLWSRRPSKGRHRRGLSILAGRAERVSLSKPRRHLGCRARRFRSVSPPHGEAPTLTR